MELSKYELLWIECALETELIHRESWRDDKAKDGLDTAQDVKDINAIKALQEKIRAELAKG